MTEREGGESLDLADATTRTGTESDGSSENGSSEGGGSRSHVVVKGQFGTTWYDAGTECEMCGRNAEGVLVSWAGESQSTDRVVNQETFCRRHREKAEEDRGIDVEKHDYRRFNQ
jgi:hypothetical protein